MEKFRLLLLDANIIIEISRHGLFRQVIRLCEVHLAQTVINEAQFFDDENGNRQPIDLTELISTAAVTVFSLVPSELAELRSKFSPAYFEKLDPGETESLAYLFRQPEESRICSADKIVFRVLGASGSAEQGISLEEVLEEIGLARKLSREFTQQYREQWTKKGFQEGLQGRPWGP